jgi:hypothetical protein
VIYLAEEKGWAGQSSWGSGNCAISGLPLHRVLWGRVAARTLFFCLIPSVRTVLMSVKYRG